MPWWSLFPPLPQTWTSNAGDVAFATTIHHGTSEAISDPSSPWPYGRRTSNTLYLPHAYPQAAKGIVTSNPSFHRVPLRKAAVGASAGSGADSPDAPAAAEARAERPTSGAATNPC